MDDTFVPFSSCLAHLIPQKEIKIQSMYGCVMSNSRLIAITLNNNCKFGF